MNPYEIYAVNEDSATPLGKGKKKKKKKKKR